MASALRQRVTTAIIIGIPILLLVFYSDISRSIFLLALGILLSFEYLGLFHGRQFRKPAFFLPFMLSVIVLLAGFYWADEVLVYYLALSLLGNMLLIYDLFYRKNNFQYALPALWLILYISLPLGAFLAFHTQPIFSVIIISILLLTWLSDISAYFVGTAIGKRKLYPAVSPGKTWEGFLGAGFLVLLFSYAFFSYFKLYDVRAWAIFALTVWFFGVLGDLVESKLKRSLHLKDSAQIMPGHGGFLDRFDAFIFCLPFALSLVYIIQNLEI
jgi:phosphatidate cytidylyltransferase